MVKDSASLDTTFAALSDATRRTILTTLQRGHASVTELARPHSISMPAILKHLNVLEQAGLIAQKKTARVRMCRLPVGPMQQTPASRPHHPRHLPPHRPASQTHLHLALGRRPYG